MVSHFSQGISKVTGLPKLCPLMSDFHMSCLADTLSRGPLLPNKHSRAPPMCQTPQWELGCKDQESTAQPTRSPHLWGRRGSGLQQGLPRGPERTAEGHLWAWEVFTQEITCKLHQPRARGTSWGGTPSRGDSACPQSSPASEVTAGDVCAHTQIRPYSRIQFPFTEFACFF